MMQLHTMKDCIEYREYILDRSKAIIGLIVWACSLLFFTYSYLSWVYLGTDNIVFSIFPEAITSVANNNNIIDLSMIYISLAMTVMTITAIIDDNCIRRNSKADRSET